MKKTVLAIVLFISVTNPDIKPHFQLTGNRRPPVKPEKVNVFMALPRDEARYEIIGKMSECGSDSKYSALVSVFKRVAAEHGANCIVVSKERGTTQSPGDTGICVKAIALYLKPLPKNTGYNECSEYLKQIYMLKKVIDSLENEIRKK